MNLNIKNKKGVMLLDKPVNQVTLKELIRTIADASSPCIVEIADEESLNKGRCRSVYINEKDWQALSALGGGNASEGIRIATSRK